MSENLEELKKKEVEEITPADLTNQKILEAYSASSPLYDTVKSYLNQIGKIQLLTPTEERELLKRVKQGDQEAKKKLIEANLRLVVSIVRKNKRISQSFEFLDLVQEGNIGLIKAIEKFDLEKGNKLSTYATWWIKQAIERSHDDKDNTIRIPIYKKEDFIKYQKYCISYYKKYGFSPREDQILTDLKITKEKYLQLVEIERNLKNVHSLDEPLSNDKEKSTQINFIPHEESGYEEVERTINEKLLLYSFQKILTPTEYYIIYHHLYEDPPKKLLELSKEFNLSKERIRQIEEKAKTKIKNHLERKQTPKEIDLKAIVNMNFTPIPISTYIKLNYLKKELNNEEYYLFYMHWFKAIPLKTIAPKLAFSLNTVQNIYNKLQSQYRWLLEEHPPQYPKIKTEFLTSKDTNQIFNVNVSPNYINLAVIEKTIHNMSVNEIKDMLGTDYQKLTPHQKNLIDHYFNKTTKQIHPSVLEKVNSKINLELLGYHKNSTIPLEMLYKIFKENEDKFDKKIANYLEMTLFKNFPHQASISLNQDYFDPTMKNYSMYRLEAMYYHIDNYFQYNIPPSELEKVLTKFSHKFSKEAIQLLKLRYGIGTKRHSIIELSQLYQQDYIEIHDRLRTYHDRAINQFLGIKYTTALPNENRYLPFLNNPKYQMTEQARKVGLLYFIHHKSYKEICQELNIINTTRVSNILTETIRQMDYWYYGLADNIVLDEEKVYQLLENQYTKAPETTKQVIIGRFIYGLTSDINASKNNISQSEVNKINSIFSKKYTTYYAKKDLSIQEITREVTCHISDSILTIEERRIISLTYGIKSDFNPDGVKYNREAILALLKINDRQYSHLLNKAKISIGARINKIITPEFGIFTCEEIRDLLQDRYIPISEKEKELLKYIKGIYEYKDVKQLAPIFQMTPGSIKRRIKRALITLKKYKNQEIEKKLDYELDIQPLLKYFPLFEQNILYRRFHLLETAETIGATYHLAKEASFQLTTKVTKRLLYLLKCPNAKKFDFDYAREVVTKEELPYYGNKPLAIQIFNMSFGEDGSFPKTSREIIQELALNPNTSTSAIVKNIMIAVLKYKDGIYKNKNVTYQEVASFYLQHKNDYTPHQQKYFERTLKNLQSNEILKVSEYRNEFVIYEILKSRGELVFNFHISKPEAYQLIKNNPYHLSKCQLEIIRNYFQIPNYELMSGKDKRKVIKLLTPYVIRYLSQKKQQEKECMTKNKERVKTLLQKAPSPKIDRSENTYTAYLIIKNYVQAHAPVLITSPGIDYIYAYIRSKYPNIDVLTENDLPQMIYHLQKYVIQNLERTEFNHLFTKQITPQQITDLIGLDLNTATFWKELLSREEMQKIFEINIPFKDFVRTSVISHSVEYLRIHNNIDKTMVCFHTKDTFQPHTYYEQINLGTSLTKLKRKSAIELLEKYREVLVNNGIIMSYFPNEKSEKIKEIFDNIPYQEYLIPPVKQGIAKIKKPDYDKLIVIKNTK